MTKWEYCWVSFLDIDMEIAKPTPESAGVEVHRREKGEEQVHHGLRLIAQLGLDGWEPFAATEQVVMFKRPLEA